MSAPGRLQPRREHLCVDNKRLTDSALAVNLLLMNAGEAWNAWKEAKADADRARDVLADVLRMERDNGQSLSDLASRLGISRERVRKLTGDPDDRRSQDSDIDVRCPRCDAAPNEICEGKKVAWRVHLERSHRRFRIQEGKELPEIDEAAAMATRIAQELLT